MQNLVILIYGVGVHRTGELQQQVRDVIEAYGATREDVHEFPWESLAGYSVGGNSLVDYRVTPDYLARVMTGFRGAIHSTRVEDQTAIRSWTAGGLALLGDMLLLGLCLYPIAWSLATSSGHQSLVSEVANIWLSACVVLGFVSFATAIAGHAAATLPAWHRRLVFLVLRPIVFLTYLPFTLKLAFIGILIGTTTILYIPAFTLMDKFSDSPTPMGWLDGLRFASPFLIVAAIFLCATVFLVMVLGPLLKVVADVVRYAGSGIYRERLHEGLAEKVKKLDPAGKRILLVGHSLGSVIALNSLLRSDSPFRTAGEIVFVTMGSPLRRLFQRYFPEHCSDPENACRSLVHRGVIRGWINMYRPFDPIGTRLGTGSPSPDGIRDVNTEQYRRLLIWAHTGYWTDNRVLELLKGAIIALTPSDSVQEIQQSKPLPAFFASSSTTPPVKFRQLALLALITPLALGLIVWSELHWTPEYVCKQNRNIVESVEAGGKVTRGWVEWKKVYHASDKYTLQYEANIKTDETRTILVHLTDENADRSKLYKLIGWGREPHQLSVDVKYVPDAPDTFFVLPDYPPPTELDGYKPSFLRAALSTIILYISPIGLFNLLIMYIWLTYQGYQWKRDATGKVIGYGQVH